MALSNYISWFDSLAMSDINEVGGKNASLGEMISNLAQSGVKVPKGFALTTAAFKLFLVKNEIEQKIADILANLDSDNLNDLAAASKQIKSLILAGEIPPLVVSQIKDALKTLYEDDTEMSLAIRSSATTEDLVDASFAGQQESLLNIKGESKTLEAIKHVYASLYNERAISYRVHQGFSHESALLSVGIQQMVRSDLAQSGVMFTIDTESGFDQVVFITSAFGLGETIVQGAVNPDEFYVYKPLLRSGKPAILRKNLGAKTIKMIYSEDPSTDECVTTLRVDKAERLTFSINDQQVQQLAAIALKIEDHYKKAMDIEWAIDGISGEIYVVQARPETVKSNLKRSVLERYILNETGQVLCEGRSVGHRIGKGPVKILSHLSSMSDINEGDILVADMTDPDWEPIMKKASAIVTNRGGRTCHAAIIARELGIPAVVGCGDATRVLTEGQHVTVSCAEGDTGFIYEGALNFEHKTNSVGNMPDIPVDIMMNIGNPDRAFDFQSLPNSGVGLARLEFIINRMIGIHPKAILNFDELPPEVSSTVKRRISGYPSALDFYVDKLAEGISTLAAAFAPKKVIVRLSDFKSNEYANLIGGRLYEPTEENPMLGFRGAARYISKSFRDCFELECRAIKKVRNEMGFTNIELMVPFVRTLGEAKQVVELLGENGLKRGENGLRIIMMCELPANALLADKFLEYFDGFSIGSNDLTQLTLGLDRDSGVIAHLFDERNEAIKSLLHMAITACKKQNKYIGICGQGPSDHPDFAQWIVSEGVETISLNPDSVLDTWFYLADKSL
ncbi:MAG: pyruvate,water dikinase [Bermanella sp.]|jgi:pyruvate,water dikinase